MSFFSPFSNPIRYTNAYLNESVESGIAPPVIWILSTGSWNDSGVWDDSSSWDDGSLDWILSTGIWNDLGAWDDSDIWNDS